MDKSSPRLIKQSAMLRKYFGGISDSTAERRLYLREDFPKPLDAFPGMNLRDETAVESFVEKLIAERDALNAIQQGASAMLEEMAAALNDTLESGAVTDPAIIDVVTNLGSRIRSDASTVLGYENAQQD